MVVAVSRDEREMVEHRDLRRLKASTCASRGGRSVETLVGARSSLGRQQSETGLGERGRSLAGGVRSLDDTKRLRRGAP
jgi:hypothetical protein